MICTVLKQKESIKSVTPAKGLTIISKLRTSLHENMEKLLMVWVTEKQLQGDTLTQTSLDMFFSKRPTGESEKNVAKKAKTSEDI
ncbi:tigger transposable element-derived protein 1 [Nephila pilipes]|uniref:Tigger transposable element-derived protein 1 n=1 Tax=Nephila pilipes TaxID=299642 RepID=A0A8X6PEV1_NEPPI|nr:tigger transposable element-derived protein 1 [Nephila pilipes]